MVEIEKPRIECIENPGDNSYGKYVVEPLERGYGTTLGCVWMNGPPPAGACSTTCTSMTPGTSPPTPAASASTTPGPQPGMPSR